MRCAGKARRRCGLIAREEEQRCQRATVQLNRVRSAFTQAVNVVVGGNVRAHAVLPVDESGQLPDLGSVQRLPKEHGLGLPGQGQNTGIQP